MSTKLSNGITRSVYLPKPHQPKTYQNSPIPSEPLNSSVLRLYSENGFEVHQDKTNTPTTVPADTKASFIKAKWKPWWAKKEKVHKKYKFKSISQAKKIAQKDTKKLKGILRKIAPKLETYAKSDKELFELFKERKIKGGTLSPKKERKIVSLRNKRHKAAKDIVKLTKKTFKQKEELNRKYDAIGKKMVDNGEIYADLKDSLDSVTSFHWAGLFLSAASSSNQVDIIRGSFPKLIGRYSKGPTQFMALLKAAQEAYNYR